MSRRLTVTVGRDSPGAIEAPATFETTEPFTLGFENEGQAVHVHVAPDDDLAGVLSVDEPNHFLDGGGSLSVPVQVASVAGPTAGELELVTGYGAESRSVAVTVAPETEPAVETSAEPPRGAGDEAAATDTTPLARLTAVARSVTAGGEIPTGLTLLSGLAVVVALWTAVTVGGLAGALGALVLIAGVGAAVWLVATDD